MRRRRPFVALVLAASLGAVHARAQGSGATAELEWITESPSDCITRERFEQRTADEAGRPVFIDAGADVTISIVLIRVYDPDGWHASVTARTADGRVIGTRELTNAGDSCALADKLALIVALMVDPGLGTTPASPSEPEPPAEEERPPRHGHVETSPVVPVDEGPVYVAPSLQQPKPIPTHVEFDGYGLGGLGMLPHLALGAELGVAVHPPWFWAIRVSATGFAEQTESVDVGRARFRMLFGTLALCPHDEIEGHIWSRVCAGVGAGPFWVQSAGLAPSRETVTAAFQASLTGNLAVSLSRGWYASALLEATVPILEKRYVVDLPSGAQRSVFRMSDATVALGVGLGVILK